MKKNKKNKVLKIEEPVKGIIEDTIVEKVYRLTLKVNNETQESLGDTLTEAIGGMKFPLLVKTKIYLTFTDGKKEVTKVLTAFQLRRILINKTFCGLYLKMINLYLK